MAYSRERRLEVLAAADRGLGTREIAFKFNCIESQVRRVKQEYCELGKTGPAKTRNTVPDWYVERERTQKLTSIPTKSGRVREKAPLQSTPQTRITGTVGG